MTDCGHCQYISLNALHVHVLLLEVDSAHHVDGKFLDVVGDFWIQLRVKRQVCELPPGNILIGSVILRSYQSQVVESCIAGKLQIFVLGNRERHR